MREIKNWNDIPRFTSNGNYKCDYELFKYFIWHIEKEIEEGLQLQPDFQRAHVWNEEQQTAYIEYILMGGMSGRDFYMNAPDWPSVDSETYVLVDGLQRITAIMKFYNNQIKAFGKYYNEFEGKYIRDAYVTIHVNNLKTRKEVLQWYIELNTSGVPHTKAEINKVKDLLAKEK